GGRETAGAAEGGDDDGAARDDASGAPRPQVDDACDIGIRTSASGTARTGGLGHGREVCGRRGLRRGRQELVAQARDGAPCLLLVAEQVRQLVDEVVEAVVRGPWPVWRHR